MPGPQVAQEQLQDDPGDAGLRAHRWNTNWVFQVFRLLSAGLTYLVREPLEEAPGEVEHVDGARDLGVHVFDADEPADGSDGSVAAEAIAWKEEKQVKRLPAHPQCRWRHLLASQGFQLWV